VKAPILRRARHFKTIILDCPNYLKKKKEKKSTTPGIGGKKNKKNWQQEYKPQVDSTRISAGGFTRNPRHKAREPDHQVPYGEHRLPKDF